MVGSEEFIELTNRLQNLFQERDNSYTLCVVIGEIECALLRFIHKVNRPLTMKEIAEMYDISNSKVTRVLDNLARKGFVERQPSQIDRRSCIAYITEEGKKMAEDTQYNLNQLQKEVLKKIPEDDIQKMYNYMKLFIDAYEQTIEKSMEISDIKKV